MRPIIGILLLAGTLFCGSPAIAGAPKEPNIDSLHSWYKMPNRIVVLVFYINGKYVEYGHVQREIMDKPEKCLLKFEDDEFIYLVSEKLLYRIQKDPILWGQKDKLEDKVQNWEGVVEKTWPLCGGC